MSDALSTTTDETRRTSDQPPVELPLFDDIASLHGASTGTLQVGAASVGGYLWIDRGPASAVGKRKRRADAARPRRESAAAPPARPFARHQVSHVASLPPRRLPIPFQWLFLFSAPALLIGLGTVGYRVLEGWSWFDSFYVAVITLTSIGYGQRAPLTIAGRVFTLVLALGGIFTVAFVATKLLSTILTGELRNLWGKRRMAKRIDALEQHVIVCGYGHVGQHVCADLLAAGVPVVVIDRGDAALAAAREAGAHTLLGDAIADATLTGAGIDRARALVAAAGADSDNVLITMTARLLRPGLTIVSRAEEDATVPKLLRAGASRTVSPYAMAGGCIAQAVLRPAVLDFVEDATRKGEADLQLEEQLVRPGSALDGKTVGTSGLRSWSGLILVAIKRRDGRLAFNPEDDAPVVAGDTLITLGNREQLGRADALAFAR